VTARSDATVVHSRLSHPAGNEEVEFADDERTRSQRRLGLCTATAAPERVRVCDSRIICLFRLY